VLAIDKVLVYIKQSGGQPVPVTVRVEWLPDGKIKPILYWTPDGSCYEIKHIHECTLRAYLKEKDMGVRFRVRAEVIETPEPYSDYVLQHETYLYFADDWFCGKNIIDSRYGHAGKEYVRVTLDVFPDSGYELINFTVKGENYSVAHTVDIEQCGNFAAGGIGVRHKV